MTQEVILQKTEKGLPVVSVNGRQTCSFVDPEKEADDWVKHYAEVIRGRTHVVVLGLGSGYHVEELLKATTASVFIVENNDRIIENFKRNFASAQTRIQIFRTSLDSLSRLAQVLEGSFVTLPFAPAVIFDRERYQSVYEWLCGRTTAHLAAQFELRGVDHFFCSDELDFQSPAQTYRQIAEQESLPARWRTLFKMMGELIK